ncbi:MAG: SPOR domain-containing protein [Flavobacteriales bacterium]|nr:SPOR domain-containing protein [Flavobacteriales bacterium]
MLESLLKALNNFNSITLPGFGGIMKMGSSYMFNEFLKFNDGKFSKFLQETDGISKEEANIKIENFIQDIKNELSKTGSFSLNEFGMLNQIDGKLTLKKTSLTTAEEEVLKKETNKKEIKKPSLKKSVDNFSEDFTVKEAREKINSLNDKNEIIFFTRGDNRKSIIETLNQKLKSLNNIDKTELDILEASQSKTEKNKNVKNIRIKEGSKKEVKEQVAKESDILKTVIEKEIEDNTIEAKEQAIETTPTKAVQTEDKALSIEKKKIENTKTKEEEDLVALSEGAVKMEKEAKRRKRNKIIFLFALICILSGSSIIGYLKQELIASWFENSEQLADNSPSKKIEGTELDNNIKKEQFKEVQEETVKLKEVIAKEDLAEEDLAEEDVPEEEPIEQIIEEENTFEQNEAINDNKLPIDADKEDRTQIGNQVNYYVVVGSFSKEKNAKNLSILLLEEGYNDAVIFQNGNLKSVSLGMFSTVSEAKEVLKRSGRSGWVKKTK